MEQSEKEKTNQTGRPKKKPMLTTELAFDQLYEAVLTKAKAHNQFRGVTAEQMRKVRVRYKNGTLSIDKKEWFLQQAGYKVVQEKLWA